MDVFTESIKKLMGWCPNAKEGVENNMELSRKNTLLIFLIALLIAIIAIVYYLTSEPQSFAFRVIHT